MPKSRRVVHDGAVLHITQRGNNRQKIFRDDKDCAKFISLIRRYKKKFAFDLYNYNLMPNHPHLLMRIMKRKDLPKLMQGVLQSFRFYYKRKYGYTGYLYDGRYKSKIVDNDAYLLDCARYIERNPLRARLVKDLSKHKWSSYLFYAYGRKDSIITENPLYAALGRNESARRKAYREYVLAPRPYEDIIDKEFKIT
ncbi:MAG: transposase [Candidatus Omnitrophota bacterium]